MTTMDITTMATIIITINHHKATMQSSLRNRLSEHEKAMLSCDRQHGFFILIGRVQPFPIIVLRSFFVDGVV